jgi:hypothetical protein
VIHRVRLRRFKRFGDVEFVLPGHVVLAGPNNTGKTTVLQAIAAWSLALDRLETAQRLPAPRRRLHESPHRAAGLLGRPSALVRSPVVGTRVRRERRDRDPAHSGVDGRHGADRRQHRADLRAAARHGGPGRRASGGAFGGLRSRHERARNRRNRSISARRSISSWAKPSPATSSAISSSRPPTRRARGPACRIPSGGCSASS